MTNKAARGCQSRHWVHECTRHSQVHESSHYQPTPSNWQTRDFIASDCDWVIDWVKALRYSSTQNRSLKSCSYSWLGTALSDRWPALNTKQSSLDQPECVDRSGCHSPTSPSNQSLTCISSTWLFTSHYQQQQLREYCIHCGSNEHDAMQRLFNDHVKCTATISSVRRFHHELLSLSKHLSLSLPVITWVHDTERKIKRACYIPSAARWYGDGLMRIILVSCPYSLAQSSCH